jgi:hypothetical protein
MMRRASPAVLVFLAVVGVLIIFHGRPIVASQTESRRASQVETDDDRLVRVERGAPGFGGMFLDADGRLVVYLRDVAQLPAARTAIEHVFGSSFVPSAGVRALKGQYTISQLKGWSDRSRSLLATPGVTMVDLDEARNRVAVGVDNESRTKHVSQKLFSLGIPRGAVDVHVTGPIRPVKKVDGGST